MSKLNVHSTGGHKSFDFTAKDHKDAVEEFKNRIEKKYHAVSFKNGEQKKISEFDPEADEILMFTQGKGG